MTGCGKNFDDDRVWKALSDRTRREILDLLHAGPKTTGQLCSAFANMTRFGVMKHLALLEEAGLIVARKDGRERWNYLNPVPIQQIQSRWVARYEGLWADKLIEIKNLVEREEKP